MGPVNFRTSDIVTLGTLADIYNVARDILSKYSFYYYHIEIRPGYYEGFSIDIENNFSYCYRDYTDKQEAQKELTQLKRCLLELAAAGLVSCHPGRYTGRNQTKKDIINGIKNEREYIKTIPTWYHLRVAGEV